MKERDRISLALPDSTIGGKKGVVLRPGERLTLPVSLSEMNYPVRRHLRILGETDIFWRWRCEPGMPLLYRSIQDALDPKIAYAEKYSLHLRSKFAQRIYYAAPRWWSPREGSNIFTYGSNKRS